jgi:hypothetical protein
MEDSSADAEHVQPIRDALGKLVTDGLVPYNVGDNGECLLDLGLVKAHREALDGDADEAERYGADTRALTAVLEDAVAREEIRGKHRRLLRAVLPLKPELVGKSIKERRTEAGKDLRPDKDDVRPGTIRNHYEPKALDKLAAVLWQMEQEFQAAVELGLQVEATSAQQGVEADSQGSGS